MTGVDLTEETIFTWGAPPLKFGAGAVDEIGFEMAQYGARRVLILTDPRINELQRRRAPGEDGLLGQVDAGHR
jgi:hydroxyacid-oxoacid transhydrogenase